jgi:hypothetical protein
VGGLLVLLALLLRFAIPAGYMLSPDGALAVVPCPAAAAVPAPAPMPMPMAHDHHMHMAHADQHEPASHDHSSHAGDRCPFGALSAPATLPAPPLALALPRPVFANTPVRAEQAPRVAALAAPPPPSRGPPLLS